RETAVRKFLLMKNLRCKNGCCHGARARSAHAGPTTTTPTTATAAQHEWHPAAGRDPRDERDVGPLPTNGMTLCVTSFTYQAWALDQRAALRTRYPFPNARWPPSLLMSHLASPAVPR